MRFVPLFFCFSDWNRFGVVFRGLDSLYESHTEQRFFSAYLYRYAKQPTHLRYPRLKLLRLHFPATFKRNWTVPQ
jgi:hypothetical protein